MGILRVPKKKVQTINISWQYEPGTDRSPSSMAQLDVTAQERLLHWENICNDVGVLAGCILELELEGWQPVRSSRLKCLFEEVTGVVDFISERKIERQFIGKDRNEHECRAGLMKFDVSRVQTGRHGCPNSSRGSKRKLGH